MRFSNNPLKTISQEIPPLLMSWFSLKNFIKISQMPMSYRLTTGSALQGSNMQTTKGMKYMYQLLNKLSSSNMPNLQPILYAQNCKYKMCVKQWKKIREKLILTWPTPQWHLHSTAKNILRMGLYTEKFTDIIFTPAKIDDINSLVSLSAKL